MVNFKNFAGSAVILQPTASKVTVEDCISKEPVSEIGGLRRDAPQQRCYGMCAICPPLCGMTCPGADDRRQR
jgi:hypothetical protein